MSDLLLNNWKWFYCYKYITLFIWWLR